MKCFNIWTNAENNYTKVISTSKKGCYFHKNNIKDTQSRVPGQNKLKNC